LLHIQSETVFIKTNNWRWGNKDRRQHSTSIFWIWKLWNAKWQRIEI